MGVAQDMKLADDDDTFPDGWSGGNRELPIENHKRGTTWMSAGDHELPEDEGWRCRFDGKSFTYGYQLDAHLMEEHDALRYPCLKCGKEFRTPIRLQRHDEDEHSGIVVTCERCGREFVERDGLKKHIKEGACERIRLGQDAHLGCEQVEGFVHSESHKSLFLADPVVLDARGRLPPAHRMRKGIRTLITRKDMSSATNVAKYSSGMVFTVAMNRFPRRKSDIRHRALAMVILERVQLTLQAT